VAAIWARRLSCLLFASSRLLLRFSKVLLMFRPWVPDPGTKKATRIPGTHKPGVYPGSSLVPQNLSRWLTTSGCRQCGRKYMGQKATRIPGTTGPCNRSWCNNYL
jgi:hypothetical protein